MMLPGDKGSLGPKSESKTMQCPKCSSDMVTARATNFGDDYWYCQGCKKELAELMVLEEVPVVSTLTYDDALNIVNSVFSSEKLLDQWKGIFYKEINLRKLTYRSEISLFLLNNSDYFEAFNKNGYAPLAFDGIRVLYDPTLPSKEAVACSQDGTRRRLSRP